MNPDTIEDSYLDEHVKESLEEDLGEGDVTSELLPHPEKVCHADIVAREEGILSGRTPAERSFNIIPELTNYSDELVSINWHYADGDRLIAGTSIGEVQGPAGLLLAAERVALNYLQQMSAVATRTKTLVDIAQEHEVKVYDTRKTVPHNRKLQKYSVRCGGGFNHRLCLSEAVLIKDNHKKLSDGLASLVKKASNNDVPVIVEIHELNELKGTLSGILESDDFDIDVIMLDNILPEDIQEFLDVIPNSIEVEASGGIDETNLEDYCRTGIDRVSAGSLTHSLDSVDMSLEF